MRIGIDLHTVNDFMQGSRTYILNVTRELLELDDANEYVLYFSHIPTRLPSVFAKPSCSVKTIFPSSRVPRLIAGLPMALARDRIDVFHCQYMGPPLMRTPYVVTLHDILHEIYPDYYPFSLRLFMSLLYPLSARKAARILTVSEFSKGTIISRYGIPAEKITVTYNGVSEEFHPIEDKTRVAGAVAKYGIVGRYILFVGRLEPRKNVPGLIRSYHLLKQTRRIEQKLVIAGMRDFKYDKIDETIRELSLEDSVIQVGRVDDADLPCVMNGADLFVYPSFAEGFGIPPLEAMACGVPAITSNTTSLPETVGDAAITVTPDNTKELADAMYEVLSRADLRGAMIAKGLKRAKLFSWRTTAEQTLAAYRDVVARQGRR